jgi:hypothetical protein
VLLEAELHEKVIVALVDFVLLPFSLIVDFTSVDSILTYLSDKFMFKIVAMVSAAIYIILVVTFVAIMICFGLLSFEPLSSLDYVDMRNTTNHSIRQANRLSLCWIRKGNLDANQLAALKSDRDRDWL